MQIDIVSKPGPKPQVTVELVRRVSERVARGIPIHLAVSKEGVKLSTYQKHLQRHSELAAIQDAAKLEFLEKAISDLCGVENPSLKSLNLRWLLERRHSDLFAPPQQKQAEAPEKQTIRGVPEEVLERIRVYARGVSYEAAGQSGDGHRIELGGWNQGE